jgi:ATP-binding protein involved in chromosome partitioning
MTSSFNEDAVLDLLKNVQDPALNENVVAAKLVRDIKIDGSKVTLTLVLIAPLHPHQKDMERAVRTTLQKAQEVNEVEINTIVEVPGDGRPRSGGAGKVRNIIAVASGKGGVGKSTLAANLAVSLAKGGAKVGLMDADVYGPNIPTMMGIESLPPQTGQENTIIPAEKYGVKVMSIGFLVSPEQPMIWRGPMLHSAVRQFTQDVVWEELDYLVIDLPPGTGDVQLSLAQTAALSGGVLVTLPQNVSLEDARRGLYMFTKLDVPIFGIVENMSYLELPDGQKVDVFGGGGGENLAKETGVTFIGGIPMDPAVRQGGDAGEPIVLSSPDCPVSQALIEISQKVALMTSIAALNHQSQGIKISFE